MWRNSANKYIGDWKKVSETSLPKKEDICSSLNVEDIANADCRHVKKFSEKTT